eukprot:GHUV01013062.1.p1 GENE.GHUV01013062.1~~GHUV01013062.1.p1  ORF type:complete len:145 (+),score=25.63 GHUV01013062.1:288-722(+)
MPSSNVNAGINGVRTPKAAYTTLSIDDDAALLLGKTDGLRPVRQSRSTLKRLFPNLDNGAKEEFSHEAGGNWPRTERWCPEEQAGWFSKLFFIFANSLVSLGSRKHLEQSDLWDTAHQDDPRQLWEQYSQQLEVTADDDAPQVG